MQLMIETKFCSSGVFNLIEIIANFPKLKKKLNWSEMARVEYTQIEIIINVFEPFAGLFGL